MSTPADPNLPGSADPNKADTTQGLQDQTEHRGTPGQQTAPYPQAPGDERSDNRAKPVFDADQDRGGEGGHSGTYVPAGQADHQTPAGTKPDTDPELGGGKGQGAGAENDDPPNRAPATTQDPETPVRPAGRNIPKPRT